MLALADLTAGLLASFALTIVGNGQPGQFAWALLWVPAWVVSAKLLGLYDRDERSLRHLTVNEVPLLVLWALVGTTLRASPRDHSGGQTAGIQRRARRRSGHCRSARPTRSHAARLAEGHAS